ncbi:MAG: glycosyltransferase family 2 protein [Candidatus Hydrogenedentes bacterium]|nr:glycosyltransferase family 2 protein [Candidatus Hydrogenedentota bacterium]
MVSADQYSGNGPKSLSIVIPLYNEGDHVESSLSEIGRYAHTRTVADMGVQDVEFVLVDDGSSDNTWEAIGRFASVHAKCVCLRLSRNFGKEAAICAGIEHAHGAAVIVMDGDLQHPPELIPEMVRLWTVEGFDVVDAVKADRGEEPAWYRFHARLFNQVMSRLSGFDLADASDFKLLDRRVVTAFLRLSERQTFYRGLVAWLGFRHARLPMIVKPRMAGRSTWSLLRLLGLAVTGLTSFSTAAMHLVSLMGMMFLIAAIVLTVKTLWTWLRGEAVPGIATVIILQLGIGSVTMIALGIIGEYLSRVYGETKARPRYVVADSLDHRSHP